MHMHMRMRVQVLFGPLTGLEVCSVKVEGAVLVMEVRLNVNLNALTLEQVLSNQSRIN